MGKDPRPQVVRSEEVRRRSISEELSADEWSPSENAEEEPSQPQEPQQEAQPQPQQSQAGSPPKPQQQPDENVQQKPSGNEFNPCDTKKTLTVSDLAELCAIQESEALEAIRAVNHRGDDQLDCVDFEVLKEYIKAKDNRKRQKSRSPVQEQKTRPPAPKRLAPAPIPSPTPIQAGTTTEKTADQAGEAVILHGRGQMYHVDVILGDVNVQIGNAQLAYDQITAVHSSKNCCLAIMTKRGRILLQCSSSEVRDHWKNLLEARSEPASRDD